MGIEFINELYRLKNSDPPHTTSDFRGLRISSFEARYDPSSRERH